LPGGYGLALPAFKASCNLRKAASNDLSSFQFEKSDEILSHLHGQIFSGVGVETGPGLQRFHGHEPDGKELAVQRRQSRMLLFFLVKASTEYVVMRD
jgi:hypothetical protein